jgi:hypothetical protein
MGKHDRKRFPHSDDRPVVAIALPGLALAPTVYGFAAIGASIEFMAGPTPSLPGQRRKAEFCSSE